MSVAARRFWPLVRLVEHVERKRRREAVGAAWRGMAPNPDLLGTLFTKGRGGYDPFSKAPINERCLRI